MPDVYGVQATKHVAGGPANTVAAGMADSPVLTMLDTYVAASFAVNGTLMMGKSLPAGAKIVDIIITMDDLGTNTDIEVGDSDDSNRYIDAIDTDGAETKKSLSTDGNIAGKQYVVGTNDGDDVILLTNAGTGAATGDIVIMVFYTMNR